MLQNDRRVQDTILENERKMSKLTSGTLNIMRNQALPTVLVQAMHKEKNLKEIYLPSTKSKNLAGQIKPHSLKTSQNDPLEALNFQKW